MATKTHLTKQEEAQTENSVQIRAANPGSPVTNQLWVNTTTDTLNYYDGAAIVNLSAGAAVLRQSMEHTANGSTLAENSSTAIRLTGANVSSSGTALVTYTQADGRFTANQDCYVQLTASAASTSGSQALRIKRNGTFVQHGTQASTGGFNIASSTSIKLASGQYLELNTNVGSFDGSTSVLVFLLAEA